MHIAHGRSVGQPKLAANPAPPSVALDIRSRHPPLCVYFIEPSCPYVEYEPADSVLVRNEGVGP